MTIWIFCFFLVVDRDHGVFQSLSGSTSIVRQSGLANYLLLMIIVLALALAPSALPFVGIFLGWFLTPIAILLEAAAYVHETDARKVPPVATKAV